MLGSAFAFYFFFVSFISRFLSFSFLLFVILILLAVEEIGILGIGGGDILIIFFVGVFRRCFDVLSFKSDDPFGLG